jgi:hypothetical protein
MQSYRIFGGGLHSDVELPDLPLDASAHPRWVVSRVSHLPASAASVLLGQEQVEDGVQVSLASVPWGLRLTFDDTGSFDISGDGSRIAWAPPPVPNMEAVRKDILGRVFAVALDQAGIIALHGSAVAIGDAAIAFLAPKFHGKSTTATALVNAGGRLLADDIVAVSPEDEPMVLPSVPVVQLWHDAAEQVVGSARAAAEVSSPKLQVAWEHSSRNAPTPVRLAALYLLVPMESTTGSAVRRDRVNGVEAAVALLGQAKVGALLGLERRMALLERLAVLSDRVPVFRLSVPRDFNRIGELTTSLMSWHAASVDNELLGGAA